MELQNMNIETVWAMYDYYKAEAYKCELAEDWNGYDFNWALVKKYGDEIERR